MIKNRVVIIDYGLGNILHIARGLEHVGAKVEISSDPRVISKAERIVLPGIGAFPKAMSNLRSLNLIEAIQSWSGSKKPLLAICLGMQLLMNEGEEFSLTPGLGLIQGRVVQLPKFTTYGIPMKIPHIGWTQLVPSRENNWIGTILEGNNSGDSVYFIHSYMTVLKEENILATVSYGGFEIPAVIFQENIFGCQFHPENSGKVGLKILEKFTSL